MNGARLPFPMGECNCHAHQLEQRDRVIEELGRLANEQHTRVLELEATLLDVLKAKPGAAFLVAYRVGPE